MRAAVINILNNDWNEKKYTIVVVGTGSKPEINLLQGTTPIADGGAFYFGNTAVGNSSGPTTFTVANVGTDVLNLSGDPKVALSGADAAHFSVNQTATAASIQPGNTTTFTVTFTPAAEGPKTAQISIPNNDEDEDPYIITLNAAGESGAGYFTVSSITGNPTELGGTSTFTVRLNRQPNGDVVINVVTSNTGEGTISPAILTFTPLNWNAEQTVTVTGVNDSLADGNMGYTIQLSINAGLTTDTTGYATLTPPGVSVVTTDDETPSITVSPVSGNTAEDGTQAAFTVTLNSQPNGNVVFDVTSLDTGEGTVSPAALTFNGTNWNSIQTVTVTGVNDNLADGNQAYTVRLAIKAANTTDTTGYADLNPADVGVINIDNDTPGFTVSAMSGNTSESGGTATFTVKLNSQPNGDVVIDAASSDTTEGTVSPAQMTFTTVNWNAPQTVTVTGKDDDIQDGNQGYTIQLAMNPATADTTGYAGLNPPDAVAINTDNDIAGFTVSGISGKTAEDGTTAAFTVQLNTLPTGNVVIALLSSDTTEGTVSPAQLTFTPANWNAEQTVTVTGQDDAVQDGNQMYMIRLTIHESTTDTTGYAALDPPDVAVLNTDNETAGYTVSNISGSTTEAGGTAAFTVKLNSEPSGNVIIDAASSDTTEGKVSPAQLTFTPLNWNAAQTVTVTGQDDMVQDGNQMYMIQLTVNAGTTDTTGYAALEPPDVAVLNTDNEIAGFTLSSITGTTTEDGGTAEFTVNLNSEPDGNVIIDAVSSNPAEGTVSPAQLTFTPANWNLPQILTVTGQDDTIQDGDQNFIIQLTINAGTTDKTGYAVLNPPDLTMLNADNDLVMAGDVNNDTMISLEDAILLMKILTGIDPEVDIFIKADVDSDGYLSLPELIYVLQKIAI
jgi:hypothetical protein